MRIETWKCGPPPSTGQRQRYPGRFTFNIKRDYPEFMGDNTLHMFSGSCEWGISTDIREETGCDIVSPFDEIPREDGTFDNVLADPPYADYFMDDWDGRPLPKPIDVLREAARLVKPGGLIGILHIIVIPEYKNEKWKVPRIERVGIHPVLAGTNNAIRAFNVFRRL